MNTSLNKPMTFVTIKPETLHHHCSKSNHSGYETITLTAIVHPIWFWLFLSFLLNTGYYESHIQVKTSSHWSTFITSSQITNTHSNWIHLDHRLHFTPTQFHHFLCFNHWFKLRLRNRSDFDFFYLTLINTIVILFISIFKSKNWLNQVSHHLHIFLIVFTLQSSIPVTIILYFQWVLIDNLVRTLIYVWWIIDEKSILIVSTDSRNYKSWR